ncbi:MAG: hypothetical protein LBJ18_02615 [Rickettsiales bacterium]|jgi:Sec-independent protein translocase protein TatA|nr:hypothetical protein [Rickettsiales bacterium]
MFGISAAEFFVIVLIAILVIPAKDWPAVAKLLARAVKFVRELIWKITDGVEKIKEQVDLEKPIDELTQKTFDEVAAAFRAPVKEKEKIKNKKKKSVGK